MVFNQTCAAPQKFSRQPLGPVVPLRTIDWNSYAPRTRTRTLQMRSVQKPEPQVVNAELFNYGGWSARREDFMSLLEGNQVAVAIINAWASLLNFRERGKPHDLLSVFFEDSGFPALYIKVIAMQPRRLRMSWRESKNNIDSGVFAMRHMETYVGQSIASWDCGIRRGDARCVREMRVRLMSELLL
nr:zinc finger BED domain-containing protein RICESLEEPER 2-like [Ipomoea batatas]